MSVAQFGQTDYLSMSGTAYPLQIDANFAVLEQIGAQFAPHAAPTPNMTILVDAGTVFANGNVVPVAQQTTPAFTAPTSNPRIDRVVLSQGTGAVSVIAGTPAASPAPPAIPSGYLPCAQVLLQTTTSAIADSMITDERTPGTVSLGTAAYQPIGTSGAAVPLLDTANSWSAAQSFTDPVSAAAASAAGHLIQLGQTFGLFSSPGYVKLPVWDGSQLQTFILQWGSVVCPTANVAVPVTFPIKFPTAFLAVFAVSNSASTGAGVSSVSTSGMDVVSSASSTNVSYFVIGN